MKKLFTICYSLFAIHYLLFAICYSLFAIRYLLFTICYLLFAISCLYAATTAEFLRLNPSAASSGAGGTMLNVSGDVESVFLNPASIIYADKNTLGASYSVWVQNVKFGSVGYVSPFGKNALALSYMHFNVDRIEKRDTSGNPSVDKLSVANGVFVLTFSRFISNRISAGANLKLISQQYAGESSGGQAIDIGGYYAPDNKKIMVALSVQNIGPDIKNEKLPLTIKGGVSYNIETTPLKILCEAEYPVHLFLKPRIGVEYPLDKLNTTFRFGYEYTRGSALSGLSCGVGFKMNIKPTEALLPENTVKSELDIRFDYAITTLGELGIAHRVGISVGF